MEGSHGATWSLGMVGVPFTKLANAVVALFLQASRCVILPRDCQRCNMDPLLHKPSCPSDKGWSLVRFPQRCIYPGSLHEFEPHLLGAKALGAAKME